MYVCVYIYIYIHVYINLAKDFTNSIDSISITSSIIFKIGLKRGHCKPRIVQPNIPPIICSNSSASIAFRVLLKKAGIEAVVQFLLYNISVIPSAMTKSHNHYMKHLYNQEQKVEVDLVRGSLEQKMNVVLLTLKK